MNKFPLFTVVLTCCGEEFFFLLDKNNHYIHPPSPPPACCKSISPASQHPFQRTHARTRTTQVGREGMGATRRRALLGPSLARRDQGMPTAGAGAGRVIGGFQPGSGSGKQRVCRH